MAMGSAARAEAESARNTAEATDAFQPYFILHPFLGSSDSPRRVLRPSTHSAQQSQRFGEIATHWRCRRDIVAFCAKMSLGMSQDVQSKSGWPTRLHSAGHPNGGGSAAEPAPVTCSFPRLVGAPYHFPKDMRWKGPRSAEAGVFIGRRIGPSRPGKHGYARKDGPEHAARARCKTVMTTWGGEFLPTLRPQALHLQRLFAQHDDGISKLPRAVFGTTAGFFLLDPVLAVGAHGEMEHRMGLQLPVPP